MCVCDYLWFPLAHTSPQIAYNHCAKVKSIRHGMAHLFCNDAIEKQLKSFNCVLGFLYFEQFFAIFFLVRSGFCKR